MKRILLLSIAMLMGIASFAQKKGDMYVSGFFSTEFGRYKSSTTMDGYSSSGWYSHDSFFEIGAEYGYFVADNIRLSMGVSFPFSSSPSSDEDGEEFKYNVTSLSVSPNIAYYVKLADKCYYTPTAGLVYEKTKMKTKGSDLYASSSRATSWGGYINIIAFEFKVSDKFAIGINAGGVAAFSTKYSYSEDLKYKVNEFICDFSHGSVNFKLYF